ncbi:MAG: HNH endonuclease [Candidatus Paceibacterota bacterium]
MKTKATDSVKSLKRLVDNGKLVDARMQCESCGGRKNRGRDRFCSVQCQKNTEYLEYIKKWKSGKVSGVKADGVLSGHVRRYLIASAKERCSECGWSKRNPVTGLVPLEIDHIDGNHRNNRPRNLKVLCRCCHALTPTYGSLNNGFGRKLRYAK